MDPAVDAGVVGAGDDKDAALEVGRPEGADQAPDLEAPERGAEVRADGGDGRARTLQGAGLLEGDGSAAHDQAAFALDLHHHRVVHGAPIIAHPPPEQNNQFLLLGEGAKEPVSFAQLREVGVS